MHIEQLFQKLSWGVFSNLSLGNSGDGTIRNSEYPKVFYAVQEALLELYSRFLLKQELLTIVMRPETQMYDLVSARAYSKYFFKWGHYPKEPFTKDSPYILDTIDTPFKDDLIKPLSIYTDTGVKLHMDDLNREYSVFFPQMLKMQVPHYQHYRFLSLEYQAKHPEITLVYHDGHKQYSVDGFIEVPVVLMEALEWLVGHKIFTQMGGSDNLQRANTLLELYEITCAKLVDRDLLNTSTSFSNDLFKERGWV